MKSFEKDNRKWTHEEIESNPGRLAAQIVFNQLFDNNFYMWFVGNTEGNQLYTVTLSNEEQAIVGFTNESNASNYINRKNIIRQISRTFGPKVVLVNLSLHKIHEVMQNNFSASVQITPNVMTHKFMKQPIHTVIVNPNDHDFFVPINVPYIIKRYSEENEDNENIGFEIEEHKDNKELSFYEIDRESKRYVFCPEGVGENGPEFGENL